MCERYTKEKERRRKYAVDRIEDDCRMRTVNNKEHENPVSAIGLNGV